MNFNVVNFRERPDLFDLQEEIYGMTFPQSGKDVVAGALSPVFIDREHDIGRYVEPNVWVSYDLNRA